jgi:hypothetical protein
MTSATDAELGHQPNQDVVDQVNLQVRRPEQAHSATTPATDIEVGHQPNQDGVDDVALLLFQPAPAHSATRS